LSAGRACVGGSWGTLGGGVGGGGRGGRWGGGGGGGGGGRKHPGWTRPVVRNTCCSAGPRRWRHSPCRPAFQSAVSPKERFLGNPGPQSSAVIKTQAGFSSHVGGIETRRTCAHRPSRTLQVFISVLGSKKRVMLSEGPNYSVASDGDRAFLFCSRRGIDLWAGGSRSG